MHKKYSIISSFAVIMLVVVFSCNHGGSVDFRPPVADPVQLVKRGEYLVNAIGCDDCHSPKKMGPRGPEIDSALRFSGYPAGRPIPSFDTGTAKSWVLFGGDLTSAVGPWGISFSGNISSDATGIGNWTEEQFIRCLRQGKWKGLEQGRPLLPPMPWQNFSRLSYEDLRSIYAFLKTTKPVNNTVPQPIPPGGRP
ncbi:MAG: diheme cytochrome c-553 [Bacteroidetes bacterium]|nr:diheme cytochrome c-553 [Bacteroidota bacterium]